MERNEYGKTTVWKGKSMERKEYRRKQYGKERIKKGRTMERKKYKKEEGLEMKE